MIARNALALAFWFTLMALIGIVEVIDYAACHAGGG